MVTQLLEARRFQAVGFVDDQQFDEALAGRPDVGDARDVNLRTLLDVCQDDRRHPLDS
jgi:hypothetical protein